MTPSEADEALSGLRTWFGFTSSGTFRYLGEYKNISDALEVHNIDDVLYVVDELTLVHRAEVRRRTAAQIRRAGMSTTMSELDGLLAADPMWNAAAIADALDEDGITGLFALADECNVHHYAYCNGCEMNMPVFPTRWGDTCACCGGSDLEEDRV